MQLFINNFSASLVAGIDASATEIELTSAAALVAVGGADYYLLTLAEVDLAGQEVAWEVIKVTAVAGNVLAVERGIEGAARSWPAAAGLSSRVTADTLARLRDAAQAGGGSPTIIGTAYPDAAPPAIGAHYLYEGAVFVSVGNAEPEHWVQIAGAPDSAGTSVTAGYSPALAVGRMKRQLSVSSYGAPGATLPVVTLTMPAWRASPGEISLYILPEVTGLNTNINLAFGSDWEYCSIYIAPSPVYAYSLAGNTLSLTVSEAAKLSLRAYISQSDTGYGLEVELRAVPYPALISA